MSFPAARVTDMHTCPMVTGVVPHVGGPILPPCAATVLTGNLPQARVTDLATCAGPPDMIAKGSATVHVCGLPAARISDMTAHGGIIVSGMVTVLIGDAGAGGGGGGGGGMGGSGVTGASGGSKVGTAGTSTGGSSTPQNSSASGPASDIKSIGDPAAQAATLKSAAEKGTPFCERCNASG